MEVGALEVLIVGAEDTKHTNVLGTPVYYFIAQCGSQEHKSKPSSGRHHEVWWNEKFIFKLPLSEWKRLRYLKIRIMDQELFGHSGFVGEARVHLGGILEQGTYRRSIEVVPSVYNVVLEDDTYRGQIKIGFRFTVNEGIQEETKAIITEKKEEKQSICGAIRNVWRASRWKLFLSVIEEVLMTRRRRKHSRKDLVSQCSDHYTGGDEHG